MRISSNQIVGNVCLFHRAIMATCCVVFSFATFNAQSQPPRGTVAQQDPAAALALAERAGTQDELTRAVYDFVTVVQREHPTSQWAKPFMVGGYRVSFVQSKKDASLWDPTYFDFYAPAGWVQLEKLEQRITTQGPGVALVGIRQATPDRLAANPFLAEVGMACCVTALVDFKRSSQAGSPSEVSIRMVNPKRSATSLSADYSAALELLLTQAASDKFIRAGLIRPLENSNITGLFMLEPYQHDKIPVVMVHGLDSAPRTWVEAYNHFMADPVIRNRYQFWFFRYPTGNPVLLSATLLRETLKAVRTLNDPKHADTAFDNMVVIGHSMGGMLTRLMVTDPGDAFWRASSNVPFEQASLSPDDRHALEQTLFFRRLPFVKRVVFIATPHRGSDAAAGVLGKIAGRRVDMPVEVAGVERADGNPREIAARLNKLKLPDSLDNLKPYSNFVQALQTQAIYAPYHSIVGNQGVTQRGVPGSDGIVPYESSHLEGAQSELVVPADHSAHLHPNAVKELERILRLHVARN